MLRELVVRNLALIEDVRVELAAGFCAWTGETGAGKSLLLGAIGLLLGERGTAESIRAGQDELRVTGAFELDRAEQSAAARALLGVDAIDGELVLSRRLHRSGRSTASVNEEPVSIGTLRKLGEMLVDVHGQRESYSLLQPAYQLELLDAFGKLGDLRTSYSTAAERVRTISERRTRLLQDRTARQRELALVRFEREELDAAKLQAGERDRLVQERDKLLNARELAGFAGTAAGALSEDEGSLAEVLAKLIRQAQPWRKIDSSLAEAAKQLEAIKPQVAEIARTFRSLADGYEADPQRLGEVEQRLALLKKLEAKYGKPIDELIEYAATLEAKESELQQSEDDLGGLDTEHAKAFAELATAAAGLTKARSKVAKKLASEAQKHLNDLGMPMAKLEAILETKAMEESGDVPSTGADHLELMLAANPGEPGRPLRKVASGGELSRTTLALKTVLAAHDPVRTLVVFDEIDANVGGRLGDVLGQKLAALGSSHQVLCVTHLPQVASYATSHWSIRKATTGKRTTTAIVPLLSEAERVEELALMLRGGARTETTAKEAAEMLKNARTPNAK